MQIFAFSTFVAFSSYLQIINLAWCRANREMFNSLNYSKAFLRNLKSQILSGLLCNDI